MCIFFFFYLEFMFCLRFIIGLILGTQVKGAPLALVLSLSMSRGAALRATGFVGWRLLLAPPVDDDALRVVGALLSGGRVQDRLGQLAERPLDVYVRFGRGLHEADSVLPSDLQFDLPSDKDGSSGITQAYRISALLRHDPLVCHVAFIPQNHLLYVLVRVLKHSFVS